MSQRWWLKFFFLLQHVNHKKFAEKHEKTPDFRGGKKGGIFRKFRKKKVEILRQKSERVFQISHQFIQ